jgi:hypothetical protein
MDNSRRGLHYHARAGAKTDSAVAHTESNHQNYINITGSFLGPVAKSYVVLY